MKLASEVGLGGRINTAMETAFFKLAEIMPFEQVLPILKDEALKSYGHKSMKVVEKIFKQSIRPLNCCIRYLFSKWRTLEVQPRKRSENVSDFVHEIVEPINRQEGNALSVATLAKMG